MEPIERQRKAIITCIDALRKDADTTEICRHGVKVLERLVHLENQCSGLNFERSVALQIISDYDRIGIHSGPRSNKKSRPAEKQSPKLPEDNFMLGLDDQYSLAQLFPNGLDSGGILDEYFYNQDGWDMYVDPALTVTMNGFSPGFG